MKLIKPSFSIIEQQAGLEGIYKMIEQAGRTCYSPDTEVLTDSGWKRIDSLLATDNVVSYNPDDNTIIYDNPNLVVNNYEDDMVMIDHPNIKMCITKDHRVYQSVPEKRDYTFLRASQIVGLEKIPHSKQCRFRIPKYFFNAHRDVDIHIPNIVYSKEVRHGNRKSSVVTITIPCTLDFMVIAGAFISEGHTFHGEYYGTGSYCQITQDEKSKLYDKVITALTNLEWKYKIEEDPRKPQIKWIKFGTNQCWVEAFDSLFGKGSKNKHLPIWFRKLPNDYLETLISIMYLGDGSHSTTRNEKYLSISKRLLDEIQEVFILLGKNGTSNFNEEISQMCYFEESHRDSWIISKDKHVSIVPYKGKVYCTSTKSGIICIRYKGKTCWCGNCYRSEDKITENSAKEFVDRMIKSGHGAMLEHGTVYLKFFWNGAVCSHCAQIKHHKLLDKYCMNKYSKVNYHGNDIFVTTNLRVLVENGWMDDLKYLCEPTEYHEKRICVRYTSDIHFYKDITRHRVFSWAIESTRFCNYIKSRFDSSVSFLAPIWLNEDEKDEFEEDLKTIESIYFKWINKGWQPQQAAYFLIQGTKAEIIMTGFISDYKHFFDLRSEIAITGKPHPTVVELVEPLRQEFIKKGYVDC